MKKIKDVTLEEAVNIFKNLTGEDISIEELKNIETSLKEKNMTMGDFLYKNLIKENIENVDEIKIFLNVIFELEKIGVDAIAEIKEYMEK